MSIIATSNLPEQPGQPAPELAALCRRQRLTALAAHLSRSIALARGLILGGRLIDVTGIDDRVGVLCAQTLDLSPEDASEMLPALRGVLTQVELLAAALPKSAGGPHLPC